MGKVTRTSPADRGDIVATPQGQHWFFPGYRTPTDYSENENTAVSKFKLLTHLPQNANCIHPSWTCSFRKTSVCPSLERSGKGQLFKQHQQIWNLEPFHLKSFISTRYLWYGHWKVWNLFSASPSTGISVKDMKKPFPFRDDRLRMIFTLETKTDPKKRKKKKEQSVCMSLKTFPRRRWEGRLSSNREVSTPRNLQGGTKTQPDSKHQRTGRDFPSLEMDWRWTDYDICKKRIPTLRQTQLSSGQPVFIYHRGQVSWFPSAWSHCDRNDSVMANLWTESDTEIWEASSRQWLNLQDPLPALGCIRNHRQNTYLSDPHLRSWCYSSLWNPAQQNRALPGISSRKYE